MAGDTLGSIFCIFTSVTSIFIGKDDEYDTMKKRIRKYQTPCARTLRIGVFELVN